MCNASAIVCVSLNEVENIICMGCQRSVIGICPYRGHEPESPEKVTCPTLEKLRRLPRYSVDCGTQDVENVNKGETINEKEKE